MIRSPKKKLSESMEVVLSIEPNLTIITDNMIAEWGGIPYAELSVLLAHLKFLSELHQNHHWTCMGDPFYGDHQLFSRLYDSVKSEVDSIAEKAIGLGSTLNVNLHLLTSQVHKLAAYQDTATMMPLASDLSKKSLMAELNFIKVLDHTIETLEEYGTLTNGLDNMLQGIADTHEGHVYLLKQRCSKQLF